MRAALDSRPPGSPLPQQEATPYCDNKGVLNHGNDLSSHMKADQKQADLIRLVKCYSRQLSIKITWKHVRCHADKHQAYSLLSANEQLQLNVRCDAITKNVLIDSVVSLSYIHPDFPDEDIENPLLNPISYLQNLGRSSKARSLFHR